MITVTTTLQTKFQYSQSITNSAKLTGENAVGVLGRYVATIHTYRQKRLLLLIRLQMEQVISSIKPDNIRQ